MMIRIVIVAISLLVGLQLPAEVHAEATRSAPACLEYPSQALPPLSTLVSWPDFPFRISTVPGRPAVIVQDHLGRLVGWTGTTELRPVVYATHGSLVSVTRYGALYSLNSGALQRTELDSGETGYEISGRAPLTDTTAAWRDDVGRYIGYARRPTKGPNKNILTVLDDCVVAHLRSLNGPASEKDAFHRV